MKNTTLLFIFALIITEAFSQSFTAKQGGHCFTLELPEYLTKTWDLNDVASLQYQNTMKDVYVVVIEDDKEQLESLGMKFTGPREFLDNFTKDYQKESKKRKLFEVSEFELNGNKLAQVEMSWKEDDIDFYMLITSVESPKHFYKILCWTTVQNSDKYMVDFKTIARSLKD
jgi:hypothetical protein